MSHVWWSTPLVPPLWWQWLEFEANLIYVMSSQTVRPRERDPVSKKKKKNDRTLIRVSTRFQKLATNSISNVAPDYVIVSLKNP